MQFVGYNTKHDEYANLHPKVTNKHLEDYVLHLSHRKIKGITIRGYPEPIYLFLDVNRIQYFPKAITDYSPKTKQRKESLDRSQKKTFKTC